MAKINFTPDALEDMKEIKAYITDELCSEQSAINTIEKIMKRIRQLADFPEIGAPLSSIISLEVPYRFLVCGNYTAFYKVEGDEVRTTWYGIAGASVGIGACIPQCPDVIRTEYPDDFTIGGAHRAHVDIITPKLVRVIIGIDDTDTKEKGASWVASLKLGTTCPIGHFIEHKIIQLNPKVPNKTTNCCSTAVSFAVRESEVPALIEYAVDFIRKESYSEDAVITVYQGLEVPEGLREFGWSCKSVLYTPDDAIRAAEENGVQIISVTGMKGVIGAVAAIGCFDLGERSAGIPEDFE